MTCHLSGFVYVYAHTYSCIGNCLLVNGEPPYHFSSCTHAADSDESPMAEWNKDALTSLLGDLKLYVIVKNGLNNILQKAAGGFMNGAEAQAVESKHDNAEQMGELVRILRGKKNKDFRIFCSMLRKSNYDTWAEQLELKAREFKGEPGTWRTCIHALNQVHMCISN